LKNLCVCLPPSNAPSSLWSSFFMALSSPYLLSSAPSSLISFKWAFEPSIIIFSVSLSPHLFSSAPLSPWPSKVVRFLTLPLFWVRLRALTSFERAFEPSLHFERAFEPSLFLERAFEPSLHFKHAFEPSLFLERAFEPSLHFERAFEPSTILLSAPSSPHFPFSFYLGRSPITMRPFLFFTWVGHPLQRDPFLCICKKKKGK
jgi:hypothetical protein